MELCARLLHSYAGMFALCRLFFARFWLLLLLETLVLDNHLMIYNFLSVSPVFVVDVVYQVNAYNLAPSPWSP